MVDSASDVNTEAPASPEAERSALVRQFAKLIAEWEESGELYEQLAERLVDLARIVCAGKDVPRRPDDCR
jgi:hypothetical protein